MRHRKARQQKLLQTPPASLTYFEDRFYQEGAAYIAGVDEAGRGCLAGPVVAASAILPRKFNIQGLKDSKQLSPRQRDNFFDILRKGALAWSVAIIDSKEIDDTNILKASLKAMRIAVDKLSLHPSLLLVDGPQAIESDISQKPIKKGDARSVSIAAASIIAKVTRDRIMVDYEKVYPMYSFSIHKGYGTKLHLEELKIHGPTPIHRLTFAPCCHC